MEKVALLCRSSTNQQDYQYQIDLLTKICESRSWEIVKTFANKISGAKKNEEREEIMQLIDGIYTPLGLTRTFMQPIPNMYDSTIYRLTARYTAAVIDNVIYRR